MLKKSFIISLILLFVLDANAQFVSNFLRPSQGKIAEMVWPPANVAKFIGIISDKQGNTYTNIPVKELNTYYLRYVDRRAMKTIVIGSHFTCDDQLQLKIINANLNEPESAKKQIQFNAKQDNLSNVYVNPTTYKIQVLNRKNNPCDMSAFEMSVDNEAFNIDENFQLQASKTPLYFALNSDSRNVNVTITHKESGLQFVLQCLVVFADKVTLPTYNDCNREDAAFALVPLNETDDIYYLLNLENNKLEIVQLPMTIFAYGVNGANGKNGTNGQNGIDAISYTDSNGKVRTIIAGTVGKPGTDATDGEDGGRGANVLLCVPQTLESTNLYKTIRIVVRAGTAGKGGRAGKGGTHGKGSGRTGSAADGRAGIDGRDGEAGSFVYVVADTRYILDNYHLLNLCK